VLDAQALAKLAAGDPAVRALAITTHRNGGTIVTAASALAEVLHGGPTDAPVRKALAQVQVALVDTAVGRRAGELLGATGMSGHHATADSLLAVVALAQQRPVVLATSAPDDMARLTEEPGRRKADRIAVVPV
jgi:hypothetical protein